jgi:hypothetical protein
LRCVIERRQEQRSSHRPMQSYLQRRRLIVIPRPSDVMHPMQIGYSERKKRKPK